jgi:PIN domain nuclease of toxin-antitoxin system
MRIVLDTHIWIWLAEDIQLSDATFNRIDEAARNGQVLVPAICMWEVALLKAKGRLTIEEDVLSWLNRALSFTGIELCPLTPAIAARSYNLPGTFHDDPADRMIVATAIVEDAVLLTRDDSILKYGRKGYVKVQRA